MRRPFQTIQLLGTVSLFFIMWEDYLNSNVKLVMGRIWSVFSFCGNCEHFMTPFVKRDSDTGCITTNQQNSLNNGGKEDVYFVAQTQVV